MLRAYIIGGAIGANLAALAAGLPGNLDRLVAWMAVCALFCIAAALARRA